MKPEDVIADRTRPFTGAEYMQSLRDGREVYIDGERIADVTTHPALRNSVRSIARLYDALHDPKRRDVLTCPTDTGSGGYTHRFFRVPRSREDLRGAQARDRRVVAHDLWLDGPHARLQGGVFQHSRRQRRILRPVRRQCARLVQARAGNRAVHEPRHRQSADRPAQAGRAGEGRLRVGAEGDRRRHHRLRRQGGRNLGRDHPLQLHGPELEDRDRGPGHVADVHGADRRAGAEADLPHVVREGGAAERLAVRLPAVVAVRRERRDLHPRQRVRALGGRVHLPRSRARAELLSALRLHARLPVPGLHALRGEAGFPVRPAGQGAALHRRRRGARQPGATRRGDRLAQPVLVAVQRHGERSRSVGGRRGAAKPARRLWRIACSRRTRIRGSRTSSNAS